MQTRRASIKETGEELSQAEWDRFDAATAAVRSEQAASTDSHERDSRDLSTQPKSPPLTSKTRSK